MAILNTKKILSGSGREQTALKSEISMIGYDSEFDFDCRFDFGKEMYVWLSGTVLNVLRA